MNSQQQRLTMRLGRGTMAFAQQTDGQPNVVYEPFVTKSGISMAANLREAFKTADLLEQPPVRVRVLMDADALMVPVELFSESTMETMLNHAFPHTAQQAVYYNVMPDLNAVAVFSMNRDLRLVIDDHFKDVQLVFAATPVWRHLHQRSYTGSRNKLYAYFHEKHLELFSFHQNRFKYCNAFPAARAHDALYFMLYVWKQLNLKAEYDEVHLVGEVPEQDWLMAELKRYVQNAYLINPAVDFCQHPVTAIKGMPYDLMTLYVKGR